MFAKKEPKNPVVTYPKQGLAENRYTADGKIWAASNLVSWVKEKNYPVFKLPLAGVNLEHLPWEINTLDDIIWHSKRIQDTDLNHPILIDHLGRICDGYHRIVKAIIENKTEINAIRIEEMPRPDGYEE